MRNWKFLLSALLLLFFFYSPSAEAQTTGGRNGQTVTVSRPARRKIRRKNRRVKRRTIKRLPANTRARVWRNVSYYPVGGMYYVARKGAYVRAFPPRGFRIRTFPGAFTRMMVRGAVFYYSAGIFYQSVNDEYEVVTAPIG
ncbi:DUF6515 family protein, partial [Muriicola sp.]|uniref:DUF6515 family protein n=1 Tax=Muriicola sp. TaxID=2020856 RepID=UPI003C7895AF